MSSSRKITSNLLAFSGGGIKATFAIIILVFREAVAVAPIRFFAATIYI